VYRGHAYYNLQKYQEAIVDFNQALTINPDYPNAQNLQKFIKMAEFRLRSSKV
jgi:tetratricopeptide (TPR) repeat protein